MDLIPSMYITATLLPCQMVLIEHFYGMDNFDNGVNTFNMANMYLNSLSSIIFRKDMFHIHFCYVFSSFSFFHD